MDVGDKLIVNSNFWRVGSLVLQELSLPLFF
jgi:hypothetical protein